METRASGTAATGRDCLNEPRMLVGAVVGNDVDGDLEAKLVRAAEQLIELRERAELRNQADALCFQLEKAIKDCVRPLSDETLGIIVTGSVVTVGEARTFLNRKYKKSLGEGA